MKLIERIILVLLVIATATLGYLQVSSTERIAYVDTNKLLNNYEGMKAARAAYQQKAGTWKANIDTLAAEVKQEIMTYEKEQSAMSAKERELAQKLIQTKQQQLADYQRAIQDQAAQEDQQMTASVLTQVNAYLVEYGQNHQYKLILAATDMGNIVYAQEGIDITDAELADIEAFLHALTGETAWERPLGRPDSVPSGLSVD